MRTYWATETKFDIAPSTGGTGGGSSVISNPTVSTTNKLVATVSRAGVFVTSPHNKLNDGAPTVHPDYKLTRPGVVLLPHGKNRYGTTLSWPVDFTLQDPFHSETLDLAFPFEDTVGSEGGEDLGVPVDEEFYQYLCFLRQRGVLELILRARAGDELRYACSTHDLRYDDERYLRVKWLKAESHELLLDSNAPTTKRHIKMTIEALAPRGAPIPSPSGHGFMPDPPTPARPRLPIELGRCTEDEQGRVPGEIWLELIHKDARSPNGQEAGSTRARDLALFTTAPIVFPSQLEDPKVLWIGLLSEAQFRATSNRGFVEDLRTIAGSLGVAYRPIPVPNHGGSDPWVQDAALIGYYPMPSGPRHVVVQTIRRFILHEHVDEYAPKGATDVKDVDVVVFKDLLTTATGNDCELDGGGNVVASPPVDAPTQRTEAGCAGGDVPAHPRAPYGKLILGNPDPSGARHPTAQFLEFLKAQKVQPIVSIDTSWLEVGHADEIVNFTRAPRKCPFTGAGENGFAMLYASCDVALGLLSRVGNSELRKSRSSMFKGFTPSFRFSRTAAQIAGSIEQRRSPKKAPVCRSFVPAMKLDAIRGRLDRCLALDAKGRDVILLPVMFESSLRQVYKASFPDMVNLLALGNTVVVPKPWGPRVSVENAKRILGELFADFELGDDPLSALDGLRDLLLKEQLWIRNDDKDLHAEDDSSSEDGSDGEADRGDDRQASPLTGLFFVDQDDDGSFNNPSLRLKRSSFEDDDFFTPKKKGSPPSIGGDDFFTTAPKDQSSEDDDFFTPKKKREAPSIGGDDFFTTAPKDQSSEDDDFFTPKKKREAPSIGGDDFFTVALKDQSSEDDDFFTPKKKGESPSIVQDELSTPAQVGESSSREHGNVVAPWLEDTSSSEEHDDVPAEVEYADNDLKAQVARRLETTPDRVEIQKKLGAWTRYEVTHEDSVDIFEAYTAVRLSSIGLEVHFLDDWATYHKGKGEVHCGTKVRYAPITVEEHDAWWRNFEIYVT
ncbi:protein-arginine deiminase family protein [Sorangium sp. So ce341]|uniref:protein-arginine deiminase family protein n=1 Tax=Sorangium sp. So ce341 TaxID=3133302 RepID=UPI003F63C052